MKTNAMAFSFGMDCSWVQVMYGPTGTISAKPRRAGWTLIPTCLTGASRRRAPPHPDQPRTRRFVALSTKRYRWEFSKRGEEMIVDVPGALTLTTMSC
jgi:hypothetical protein